MRLVLALVALLIMLGGCVTQEARPEARVFAFATFEMEGAWDRDTAARAAEAMGFAVDGGGPLGFPTRVVDGHLLFVRGPDTPEDHATFSVSFRMDDADVCSTPTYDQWVDQLLERLGPVVDTHAARFAAETGWLQLGGPTWEVTAADPAGNLLRFPEHCAGRVACVGAEATCRQGSRWQNGPNAATSVTVVPEAQA